MLKHTLREFIKKHSKSPLAFSRETTISKTIVYRYLKDDTYIPTGIVLQKICSRYNVQPSEFLVFIPDEN